MDATTASWWRQRSSATNPINEALGHENNDIPYIAFLRRFGRDRRGASAVEFALIAPLMLGLYIGCVEISDGVAADRKVTLTAGALANLTSQVTTMITADMDNIFAASTAIMNALHGQRSPPRCPA